MRVTEMNDEQFRASMEKKHPGLDLDAKVIMPTGKLLHMMHIEGELMEEVKKIKESKDLSRKTGSQE